MPEWLGNHIYGPIFLGFASRTRIPVYIVDTFLTAIVNVAGIWSILVSAVW
jgi:hypothetical protein